MPCQRCEGDPQPKNFASPRRCAFDADGVFVPNNWSCATIDALLDSPAFVSERDGNDESIQFTVAASDSEALGCEVRGWIIFTRYKHRGCTSSAVHVGDFWPAEALTLRLAERTLDMVKDWKRR